MDDACDARLYSCFVCSELRVERNKFFLVFIHFFWFVREISDAKLTILISLEAILLSQNLYYIFGLCDSLCLD